MKDATGLFVVVLTVLMGRVGGIQPSNGYCIGNQCFTVFEDPSDFTTAQHQCREKNGHLMTVRSSVSHDILPLLLGNLTGRYWIGLHRPTGCPKNGAALRGYKWVTNDSESDFFNWKNFNSSCSSPRCVSVSEEDGFKWIQVPCGEQTDGFLCEHSLTNPCKRLVLAPGESVTYRTLMGFEGEDLLSLPQGSTAIKMPSETKYVCFSEQWLKAPWTCEILDGGCEHKCALDSNKDPTCYCEQGLTVNPANKVTCEVATDDPCLQLNCQHVCYKTGDSHSCTCNEGYKLAPDGKSCVDFNDCKDERQCPGENFKCINTPGGFQCVCEDGFKPRGGLCVDVNECESAPCEHECHNWPGTYNCSCSEGYKVDPESPDKCKLHCPDEECPAVCDHNNVFQCYCPDGYISEERVGHTFCIDIDECASYQCEQGCENTFGSFLCSCKPGYILVDQVNCKEVEDYEFGSTVPGTFAPTPFVPNPEPTRRPSGVTVGGLVGIIVCTVFFIVLVVFLAHHFLRSRGKMESAGALKASEGEAHGLHHVTSDMS